MRAVERETLALLRAAQALCVASVVACDSAVVAPVEDFPLQFTVVNNLIAPVDIAIDGAAYLTVDDGASTSVTVSSRAQWLTWISQKPMDENGAPIPDDIQTQTVAIGGINRTLEINNVIQDRPYFTARIINNTPASVSIGVVNGAAVTCASKLPGSTTSLFYTQTGYYRLENATELRAYRDPANCTGPYVTWTRAQLQSLTPKSGLLILSLDDAP